mgnify:CR=1 FL=1
MASTKCLKTCLVRIGCIRVVFAKTKRSNPAKTWSITKGVSIPQSFLHQNACPKICNHLGLSILGLSPHWKITKLPNNASELRWSTFMSLRQVNPEFTQNKEKGCQSQSPSITTFFFLKPICKNTQSNPELIDHLGLPMPIHFLKINPNVLQWLGALQSSNSFTCAWENFSQKVYGWRFVDGKKWLTKHFFDKKH